MTDTKEWNYGKIRRRSFGAAFGKGIRPWWTLCLVGFLFAFIGAANSAQAAPFKFIDQFFGLDNANTLSNVSVLKNYVISPAMRERFPLLDSQLLLQAVDDLCKGHTWVIQLFGANAAYFKRNTEEVLWILIAAAVFSFVLRFFILNASLIGRERFVMENRVQKNVKIRRALAPFHRKDLLRLMWAGFCYRFSILLWSLTVVGGFYKAYQYAMVPFLQAEDPSIGWKEAKALSARMTEGHKKEMFLTQLSCFPVYLLKSLPFIGLFVSLPFEYQLNAEFYFELRGRCPDRTHFIEPAFDLDPWLEQSPAVQAKETSYVMKDLVDDIAADGEYRLTDLIAIFFVFCFAGWLWEVCLHLVTDHELVNRGTLYGPWLPIYGCGGTGIIFLLNRFRKNPPKLFALMIALCAVLEYTCSLVLDFIYNASYWDYKEMFLNINGRICFAGLLAFGIGGMFGIYIAGPKIRQLMRDMPYKRRNALCVLLVVLFAADLVCVLLFGFNSGSGVGGSI